MPTPLFKVATDYMPARIASDLLHEYLETQFKDLNCVGGASTIISHGKVIETKTFGVKQKGSEETVDRNTVFRLASVSKGFAGILATILEQEKVFKLDDKVSKYIKGFELKDTLYSNSVSIKHTLSHSSGLAPHAFDNKAENGAELNTIIRDLSKVNIAGEPGQIYGYQNTVFSIIDSITRVTCGKNYNDLVSEKIFRPLDMMNATLNKDEYLYNSNFAMPHLWNGSEFIPIKPNTRYYNLSPAAGVNASIADMEKWLLALLGYKKSVITPEMIEKIATPIIKTPLSWRYTRFWDKVDDKYYSLGWRIYHYKGHKIIYHGGYVDGYKAEIAFCPSQKTGMAFLCNSPNKVASVSVPMFFDCLFEQAQKHELANHNKSKTEKKDKS